MREKVGFAGQAADRGLDILTKGKVSGRQAVCVLIPVIWRLHLARQAVKTNPARKDTVPQSKRIQWIGRAGQGLCHRLRS